MPTVQAIRRLRKRPERDALAIMVVVAIYALIGFVTPFSSSLQRRLMASFHFRPPSMASWVVLQPAPKMYGFANRVWRGPFLLADRASKVERRRFAATSFWVNHYPSRMARYDGERARVFAKPNRTIFVMIQSRYREEELWTALEVQEREGALHMRSIEVKP